MVGKVWIRSVLLRPLKPKEISQFEVKKKKKQEKKRKKNCAIKRKLGGIPGESD